MIKAPDADAVWSVDLSEAQAGIRTAKAKAVRQGDVNVAALGTCCSIVAIEVSTRCLEVHRWWHNSLTNISDTLRKLSRTNLVYGKYTE